MVNNQKYLIGNRITSLKKLFAEKEKFRKEQAGLPFEEKINALIDLQRIAHNWGNKKNVIVWMENLPQKK